MGDNAAPRPLSPSRRAPRRTAPDPDAAARPQTPPPVRPAAGVPSGVPRAPGASQPAATPPAGFAAGQVQFRSHTTAPSPPLSRSPTAVFAPTEARPAQRSALTDGLLLRSRPDVLRLQTDIQALVAPASAASASDSAAASAFAIPSAPRHRADALPSPHGAATTPAASYIRPSALALQHKTSNASLQPISRTPSLKTTGLHGFGTSSAASSTVPSPIITAMGDVTPLPSPLLSSDSPGPWKKLGRSPPTEMPCSAAPAPSGSAFVTANGEPLSSAVAHHAKRKAYAELLAGNPGPRAAAAAAAAAETDPPQPGPRPSHTRDRSLSEYVPEAVALPRRMVTVSAMHARPAGAGAGAGAPPAADAPYETHMRREPHLSQARGLTPVQKPPTPPPSESSLLLHDGTLAPDPVQASPRRQAGGEFFEAHGREDQKRRRWRSIKLLGQGTFSRVMLATSQMDLPEGAAAGGQPRYDRRRLVAVKICEHGPKGGASEDRIEMSLKRELELMQCIRHPSLVRLKAWNIEPTRAVLVLSYCPGGDLFDVASAHRALLTPPLLGRIFAELVGAVRYLHGQGIVHRDIKLENVLVNLPPDELADASTDWATYPYSVTTLTDLGLSRRVAADEKLETRCGSDDYAAPEVIMGQPYDGRAIDAWSLGVLLYALLEGRLPFDPTPGMSDGHRMRSRTSHRIARVEWRWIEFAGDDGDHEGDEAKFRARGLAGAMAVTEGLLKRARSRWTLDKVAATPWVRDALAAPGGLRFREEEEGEEIA